LPIPRFYKLDGLIIFIFSATASGVALSPTSIQLKDNLQNFKNNKKMQLTIEIL